VTKRIANQGIFNENLRRSFEKLVADKKDHANHDANLRLKLFRNQPTLQVRRYNAGAIQFVNSSSESELDSLSTNINDKPNFSRNIRSREALRRNLRKGSVGSSSNSSDSSFNNKCDDDKQRDYKRKYDFNQKDVVIQDLKKTNELLTRKLNSQNFENIRLRKENSELKEKEFRAAMKSSDLEEEVLRSKEREESLRFMLTRLSNIVQTQDEEIAELKHNKDTVNDDSSDVSELKMKLQKTEDSLSEQEEVNQQLKQYLQILVLKLSK